MLYDYVCISESFFLSWKVSSSKLGFPLHPLLMYLTLLLLEASRKHPQKTLRYKRLQRSRKWEGSILREKRSIFLDAPSLLTLCYKKALFNYDIFNYGPLETSPKGLGISSVFFSFLSVFVLSSFSYDLYQPTPPPSVPRPPTDRSIVH